MKPYEHLIYNYRMHLEEFSWRDVTDQVVKRTGLQVPSSKLAFSAYS
jgi:hypothetical protein